MQIIVKCWMPDWYDAVSHAIIEVDAALMDDLLAKLALADKMKADDSEFMGLEYNRYDPIFVDVCPDDISMSEEEFEALSDNGWDFLPAKTELDEVGIRPCMLMVMAGNILHHRLGDDPVPDGRVYWYGYDKHGGAESRIETYSLYAKDLREIAAEILKNGAKT